MTAGEFMKNIHFPLAQGLVEQPCSGPVPMSRSIVSVHPDPVALVAHAMSKVTFMRVEEFPCHTGCHQRSPIDLSRAVRLPISHDQFP